MTSAPDLHQHPREHFIPLRAHDLAQLLLHSNLVPPRDASAFQNLCRLLKSIFHFEYHEELLRLKKLYAPFDPDADTLHIEWPDESHTAHTVDELFDSLVTMFGRANFRRLNRVELQEAFEFTSDWGLNLDVDFSIFERLEIFARGELILEKEVRTWRTLFRKRLKQVLVHQRLVVAFRLVEDADDGTTAPGAVVIKAFKDIPKADLEMLLPGTRVRMTLFDRARIALPTISGLLVTIDRLVRGAMTVALAGAYGLVGLVALVGGTLGYGVKSFFGYLRTKDKYQADLTRNLYYQNLDNNAGVLFRLLDEVEEQEFREAILAYTLLSPRNSPYGRTLQELDVLAEGMLLDATEMDVDFEADDAINKLVRLGLVHKAGHRYQAISVDEALRRLDQRWDNFFPWARRAA